MDLKAIRRPWRRSAHRPSKSNRLLAQDPDAKFYLYLAVGAVLLADALFAVQAVLISVVIDQVFLARRSLTDVLPLLGLMLLSLLVRSGLIWGGEVWSQNASSRVKGRLRQRLMSRIFQLGPALTQGERSGELVNTLVEGVETLDAYLTRYLPARILAALTPGFIFLLALALDPLSALALLFAGPMLVLMLAFIGGKAKALTERRFLEMNWMSAFFLDILQGMTTLKAFGRSREQADNIEEISKQYGDATMDILRTAFQTALVMEWAATAATALVAVEISLRLIYGDGLDFGRALAVLLLTPEFFLPLRRMAIEYHAGTTGAAAAERIFSVLDLAPPNTSEPLAQENVRETEQLVGTRHDWESLEAPFDIRFENVIVSYAGALAAPPDELHPHENRPALRGLTLSLPPGRRVALIGPTGAGKSTVAHLLLRFITPDEGRILVNGRALSEIDRKAWRDQIAWVPQRPYLFHGDVAENIALARPTAALEQIEAAARAAHAHEFIQALPQGYKTPIGERGVRLSGGQRQRIAIARAFLKDAPLLILDELTAHLDPQSERLIHDALARLLQGRAALIISHRLKLIEDADLIVVLNEGVAVQRGAHVDLMAQPGLYRSLVAAAQAPDSRRTAWRPLVQAGAG